LCEYGADVGVVCCVDGDVELCALCFVWWCDGECCLDGVVDVVVGVVCEYGVYAYVVCGVVCGVGVDGVGGLLVAAGWCYGCITLAYVWWLAVVDYEGDADGVVDGVLCVVCDVGYGVLSYFVGATEGVVVGVWAGLCEG